ncbi:MAG TPA: hypothetical protein VLI54_02970 [Bacillota bacterium]|nr:hypothetical protein [Bacillota bacterium]
MGEFRATDDETIRSLIGAPSPGLCMVRDVSRSLVDVHPYPLTYMERTVPNVAADVLRAAVGETSLGDMLVADGQLLAPNADYIPRDYDYNVRPGDDCRPVAFSIGAFSISHPMRRRVAGSWAERLAGRTGVRVMPFGDDVMVDFPGRFDWDGALRMTFWYDVLNGRQVGERLEVRAREDSTASMPSLEGLVVVPGRHPGDGLTAYPRITRPVIDDEEVTRFVDIIRAHS